MSISDRNIMSFTNQEYQTILDEIMSTKKELMPEYTDNTDTDFGNLILTYCAMLADILSNKLDYSVNEAIPMLCETIKAMYKHCKWIGYTPQSNESATALFELTIINNGEPQLLLAGSQITMPYMINNSYVIYEVMENVDCTAPVGTDIDEKYTVRFMGIQGESVVEELGLSNGKADQEFLITYYPYTEGSLKIEIKFENDRSEFYFMNENNSFVNTNSEDKIFVLEHVDGMRMKIRFGDNFNGKIPELNTQIIAHYRIGGGDIGNRPIGSINVPLFDMPSNFISIVNITDATGGKNADNVSAIKKKIEKGQHRKIYSLMRYQDYNNFLNKPERKQYIDFFRVCKDTSDLTRAYPIVIYLKQKGELKITDEFRSYLLNEINKYKLLGDIVSLRDIKLVYVKIKCICLSDGLTPESQLKNTIIYAIAEYINELEIGNTDTFYGDFVGLYIDDIMNIVRSIDGIRRFIRMEVMDLKYDNIELYSKVELNKDNFDMILNNGQKFAIENIDTDIIVEFT